MSYSPKGRFLVQETFPSRPTGVPLLSAAESTINERAVVLHTPSSDDVLYPDHVVPLHVGEWWF